MEPTTKTFSETHVDELSVVALLQVVEDRGIVQIGQVRHVLDLLILGRVDLSDLVLLKVLFLWGAEGSKAGQSQSL